MTNNIFRRTKEHKEGRILGFTEKYHLNRLVHLESFRYVRSAIAREKEIKGWRRSKKTELIEATNPTWADLAESWAPVTNRKEQIPHPKAGFGMTDKVDRAS
jgi:putative endonuclease